MTLPILITCALNPCSFVLKASVCHFWVVLLLCLLWYNAELEGILACPIHSQKGLISKLYLASQYAV